MKEEKGIDGMPFSCILSGGADRPTGQTILKKKKKKRSFKIILKGTE